MSVSGKQRVNRHIRKLNCPLRNPDKKTEIVGMTIQCFALGSNRFVTISENGNCPASRRCGIFR